jgi:hypothetical protein
MSFRDSCACHVWAIDGYVNDEEAKLVNHDYDRLSTRPLLQRRKPPSNASEGSLMVGKLVQNCRRSSETNEEIVVYGGFMSGQFAPEHMWIEYNGAIYETMPGYGLYTEAATDHSRMKPQLERNNKNFKFVGRYKTVLTTRQKAWIDGDDFSDIESKEYNSAFD